MRQFEYLLMSEQISLQRRGERRATINEEMGGVYDDVNVLYRGGGMFS